MSLDATERGICAGIEATADNLLKQLGEYVSIPTGGNYTPGLEQLRSLLIERLSTLGAGIELLPGASAPPWLTPRTWRGEGGDAAAPPPPPPPPTVVARHPADGASPRVLIVGHLDTVHDPDGPFDTLSLSGDGRRATGPGAVDMKGGLLIALGALEALAEAGVELAWTMVLNSDEETGSFGSADALRAVARVHDLGIVMEPALADGGLALQRMGSGQFMIEFFGRSAHVGRNFADGRSAVVELARTIISLDGLARPQSGTIVNTGPLTGGTVTNTVPDHAACWGNARFVDAKTAADLAAAIDGLATAADQLPRVVVRRQWNRPAKLITDGVRRFAEVVRQAADELGQPMPFASTGGVCDGNILADEGLPTLDTLGARGGNLHRDDEYVEVSSLVQRTQLLAIVLFRIATRRLELGRAGGAR